MASQRRTSYRGHMGLSQVRLDIRYVIIVAMRRNVNAHGRMNNGARVKSRVHGVDTRILTAGNLRANMTTSMNAHIAGSHSLLRELSISHTRASAASKTCQKDGEAVMISDKERREVARKLREVTEEELCRMPLGEILGCFIGGYCLNEEGGLDEKLVLNRLADIIVPQPIDGDASDGYHTFNELYHHRAVLFSVIVAKFSDRAWKSKLHADGTMYEGMFIVGIETPDGQATYHYNVEPYWNLFKCKEVDRAPEWDGHTPDQAIERIGKLIDYKIDRPTCEMEDAGDVPSFVKDNLSTFFCSKCGSPVYNDMNPSYCLYCGAEVIK